LLDSRCLMHLLLVKTCGNDEQKQPLILWLDPGTQDVFNLPAKESNFIIIMQEVIFLLASSVDKSITFVLLLNHEETGGLKFYGAETHYAEAG